MFGVQVHLQNHQIKFVYQGHRIKVKVMYRSNKKRTASLCNMKQVNAGSR